MPLSLTFSPFKITRRDPTGQVLYEWQNGTMTRWDPSIRRNDVYEKRIVSDYPVQPDFEPFRLYDLPPELRIRIFRFFCLANLADYVEAEKRDLMPCEESWAMASDAIMRAGWMNYFPELLPCRLVSRQFYREFSETRARIFTYEMPEFIVGDRRFQVTAAGAQKVASEVMERLREFFRLMPAIERPNLRRVYVKCIIASSTASAGTVIREFEAEKLAAGLEKIESMHKDFRLTVTMTVSKRWCSKQKMQGLKKAMVLKPEGSGWVCERLEPLMVSNRTMTKWQVESTT